MRYANFLDTLLIWAQSKKHARAFTLIEVLLTIAILGTLSAIAVPTVSSYVQDAKNTAAIADIKKMEGEIIKFWTEKGSLPNSLAQVGLSTQLDPWGRPYGYLRIDGVTPKPAGAWRKDMANNPLNSDFDLFSIGRDGQTAVELVVPRAWDDIVRANNGAYVGVASEY